MAEPYQLKVEGYDGKPLSNLFWPAEKSNGWLAIIIPGLNYTSDMPVMFYTRRLLQWRGADTLNLHPAARSDAFQNSSDELQLAWLRADVLAGLKAGLEQRTYRGIVLAGKSIGSLAIAQAVSQAESLLPTAIVWLTPLLRTQVVLDAALGAAGPQAHICGGADATYIPEALNQILAKKPRARAFIAPGGNHILEVPGDEPATFTGIRDAMLFLGKFLDEAFQGYGGK